METRNRLIVTREVGGGGDKSRNKGKGLVKEHVWMTHGHGQQCGDWLWEQGVGWVEEDKWEKLGQLSQNNNKIFKVAF